LMHGWRPASAEREAKRPQAKYLLTREMELMPPAKRCGRCFSSKTGSFRVDSTSSS